MATVKERILEFIEYKGVSNRNFCKTINVSPNILSTKSALGSDILIKINIEHPELNMDWVITGRGIMLFEYIEKKKIPQTQEEKEDWYRGFMYDIEHLEKMEVTRLDESQAKSREPMTMEDQERLIRWLIQDELKKGVEVIDGQARLKKVDENTEPDRYDGGSDDLTMEELEGNNKK